MSKRKLTRKQSQRIKKVQQERLERAEKRTVEITAKEDLSAFGVEQEGVIIAQYGAQMDVENPSCKGELHRCYSRQNLPALVTGDRVLWRKNKDNTGIVVARKKRKSELCRPDNYGNLRPVAANIDCIFIVVAPVPTLHSNLIDRYLVAAETVGVEPVILLNKTDLLTFDNTEEVTALMEFYASIGCKVVKASASNDQGFDQLMGELKNCSSVFVGQSGVGKSSLISKLLPDENIKIGELSADTGKGKHTTTTARLFHLPCGGCLIDSPGIREFGLWHMSADNVLHGFREFSPFIGGCKFSNCSHTHEAECALLIALNEGKITRQRWLSYLSIISAVATK